MPEDAKPLAEKAADAFLKEWKTFILIVLAGMGTWYGIKIDMFDASLWDNWMEVGVYGYVIRTVGKSGIGAWKSAKVNGSK